MINVESITELELYFPDDEIGKEMFECVQSIPPRFREDALDLFFDPDDRDVWDWRTVDKAWSYFLDDILNEMTETEKRIYNFG